MRRFIGALRGQDARPDRRAIAILLALPVLLYGIPTLLGHPPISQDNLIQNFPLRVLTGDQIASGHLPTWNPLIFGGSPLLAALNAGSFYPLTLPFAFLPDLVAWLLNVVACYWAASLGVYALMRWLKIGSLPSLLAALGYSLLGMMAGQLVHLAVVQGQGWLPWVVLAVMMTADRLRGESAPDRTWAALEAALWPLISLAVLVGLVFLTGEPRSIADLEVVALVVAGYVVFAPGRPGAARRLLLVGALGLAAAWGVVLAAAQLLPGQEFIHLSQRANLGYWFFGSGSLALNRTILAAIPDFFGGVGLLHQPHFFVSYNISELNGYVGILGLVGLGGVIGGLVGRRRRKQPAWLWLVALLAGIGMIASWGSFTPLGHVLHAVPLLGRTRLQSRNLVIVDLAAAMALAWLVDRLLSGDREGASLTGWRSWVTFSPLIVTSSVALAAIIAPSSTYRLFGVDPKDLDLGRYMAPWLVIPIALSLWLAWLLLRSSGGTRRLALGLSALLAVDVVVAMLGTSTGMVGGNQSPRPSRSQASAVLGTSGRFALIDPNLAHEDQFVALGKPDTNVFTDLPSIQGYGSLIADDYGLVSGAHVQNGLDACALRTGRFDQLRLHRVVMAAGSLSPRVWTPLALDGSGMVFGSPPRACAGAGPVSPGSSRSLFFGQELLVRTLSLRSRTQGTALSPGAEPPKVEGIRGDGSRVSLTSSSRPSAEGWTVSIAKAPLLAGIRLVGDVHQVMTSSVVTDVTGASYSLAGIYQEAIDAGGFRLVSTTGTLSVFERTRPLTPWLQMLALGSTPVPAGHSQAGQAIYLSGRVLSRDEVGGEVDLVRAGQPTELVRSESMLDGWRAEAVSLDGRRQVDLRVRAHDLVQSVVVPAGQWRVTWRYDAPGLRTGLVASGAAALGLVVLVAWHLIASRRRAGRVRA